MLECWTKRKKGISYCSLTFMVLEISLNIMMQSFKNLTYLISIFLIKVSIEELILKDFSIFLFNLHSV